MNRKVYKPSSRLASNLSRHMLKIYLLIYVCILLLLCLFLFPIFFSMAVNQTQNATRYIADTFEQIQNAPREYSDGLTQSPQLSILLLSYEENPVIENSTLVEQYLQSYASTYSNVQHIIIDNHTGTLFQSFKYYNSDIPQQILQHPSYRQLAESEGGVFYAPMIRDTNHNVLLAAVSQNYKINETLYTVTLFCKAEAALSAAESICTKNFNDYWILQENSIYHSSNNASVQNFFANSEHCFTHSSGRIMNNHGFYFYQKIFNSESLVIGYVTWIKLFFDFISITLIITVLYLLSPVLYSFFLIPAVNKKLKPLTNLTDAISSYSIGQNISLEMHTGDELEILCDTFSKMTTKINEQVQNITVYERENAVTKFRLLTTQIDPHFIYNTMNIINVLVRKGETNTVVEVNSNLIHILQRRLNTNLSIFDTLEAEIDTLKKYQAIMNYRYANHVTVHYDIEESLLPTMILKNILQPLLENAYFHGLSNEDGEMIGRIDLSVRAKNKNILLIIRDNGRGIPQEKLQQMTQNSFQTNDPKRIHIGLCNIYQRLAYIYHEDFTMQIYSKPEKGTEIHILFPKTNEDILENISFGI